MTLRSIAKDFVIAAVTIVGVAAIAIVGCFGLLAYKAAVPERMSLKGRVTDGGGKPLNGAEVRAIPLGVWGGLGGGPKTPATEQTAVTDRNGRYRLRRLIASGGVKEGRWVQEYSIVARADGYTPQAITLKPSWGGGGRKNLDFVLGKNRTTSPSIVDGK